MLTNKHNLPEVIFKAAQCETYISKGDISVTSLIDSPKIRQFRKKYANKVHKDVVDMLPAIEGTALHYVLEMADVYNADARTLHRAIEVLDKLISQFNNREQMPLYFKSKELRDGMQEVLTSGFPYYRKYVITEEIMQVEVLGWHLKGQFDRVELDKRKLIDFKKVSVWSYANKYESKQHNLQQNIYRWMIKKELDIDIAQSVLVKWFRDWQKTKAQSTPSSIYPPQRVMEIEVPLMGFKEIEEYVTERIALHQRVELEGPDSYQCTPEEKWQSASSWKVYNANPEKQKRALVSEFYREKDALQWVLDNEHKYPEGVIVKKLEGENKRCKEYCEFRDFCNQYKLENQ